MGFWVMGTLLVGVAYPPASYWLADHIRFIHVVLTPWSSAILPVATLSVIFFIWAFRRHDLLTARSTKALIAVGALLSLFWLAFFCTYALVTIRGGV